MASSGSQSSRSCSSSEALSSDASSSCPSSSDASPACSPRGSGGAARAIPPLALNRRVPPLSLHANLAELPRDDGPVDAPGTARRPQQQQQQQQLEPAAATQPRVVPRLAMPQPAGAEKLAPPASARGCAAPPAGPVSMPLPAAAAAAADSQPPAGQAALLSLDILSPAFSLERPGQQPGAGAAAASEQLSADAASRLGVPPERLRYYALTEVAGPHQLPPGCPRAAVEVLDSRFSLSALEQLLAENQRLAAVETQAAGQAAFTAQLRDLQAENEALRQQLRKSESLRRKSHRALLELQQDFKALSTELLLSSSSSGSLEYALQQKQAQYGFVREREGTPAAVDDAQLL
ncbi:hypothetical protein COHA_001599 [Chlorella ohadii]|uniref:Uncharacterized protein n=1 Tax=Chlorella ohadii TaxID=2649997 RepID=A0AAD5DV66_9CHLO|nr:hypothetical protein COHA_001599 [Chlorella ohadii]